MTPSAKQRLFVAVDVPGEVRDAVAAAARPLQAEHPALKWTIPANWHLTLAFLGWVEAECVEAVQTAVTAVAARTPGPIPLATTGAGGTFRSGVLWAELAPAPRLSGFAEALREALGELMSASDRGRPFRAHLTLARAPKGRRLPRGLAARYEGPALGWEVTEVVVYRSHLRREGARYEPLLGAPLGAAAGA